MFANIFIPPTCDVTPTTFFSQTENEFCNYSKRRLMYSRVLLSAADYY